MTRNILQCVSGLIDEKGICIYTCAFVLAHVFPIAQFCKYQQQGFAFIRLNNTLHGESKRQNASIWSNILDNISHIAATVYHLHSVRLSSNTNTAMCMCVICILANGDLVYQFIEHPKHHTHSKSQFIYCYYSGGNGSNDFRKFDSGY